MSPNQNKLQLFEVPQIESIQDMLIKSAERYTNKIALGRPYKLSNLKCNLFRAYRLHNEVW